jgi:HPt (histidine-containing phosphotransfer) domain-containing protein
VSSPAPNPTLQELVEVLGEENVRELVRTFLHGLPDALRRLATARPEEQVRLAHALKSSARHMGADALARSLTALEVRLARPGATVAPETLGQFAREFDGVAASLRPFAFPSSRRPEAPSGAIGAGGA